MNGKGITDIRARDNWLIIFVPFEDKNSFYSTG